ncbi:hypothetical protein BVG79_02072 [Ketogulonicigenium robustum]|uniref:Flagellar protein FliL n=1 Tax=Ketogulonicigenium robustum TaxID=92947 RepID=A0A1W6P1M7_9RHOB|nr:flagellar basal body-associated FliL family protein [Ketogulonicigenium robustum]ARO15412.1 hypothetical protein BVG79_02072 [Ketogulonicigenium robustum]
MKKLIIPVALLILGTASGIGAGIMTARPTTHTASDDSAPPSPAPAEATTYVPLDEAFVVPILRNGATTSIVVMSLGLEILPADAPKVAPMTPKLRDQFLQVLYDHANTGGFDGMFTAPDVMRQLRNRLRAAASETIGAGVRDILVTDLSRQDY